MNVGIQTENRMAKLFDLQRPALTLKDIIHNLSLLKDFIGVPK